MMRHVALYANAGSPELAAVLECLRANAGITVHLAHCALQPQIRRALGGRLVEHETEWALLDRVPPEHRPRALDIAFAEAWFEALAASDSILFFGANFRIDRLAQTIRDRAATTGVRRFYSGCHAPTAVATSRPCAATRTQPLPPTRTAREVMDGS